MASYRDGERVFAKLSTWPYWPARINKLPDYINVPAGTHPIFFYGTHEVNFLSPKVILPFEENKIKFCRNNRYQYYTEAMWEIENNPDVLCIDKDDTAEEFLCDAYGVVKPMKSSLRGVKDRGKDGTMNGATDKKSSKTALISMNKVTEVAKIKVVETPAAKVESISDAKIIPKKDNLLGNLEFSDDESEDMTPLYSKLIIIAGSQDPPNEAPDSSSANHEAEAVNTKLASNHIKACWVMVEKLSQVEINKALKVAPEYGPYAQLLSQQCVTTINKETRVIDTIIIDSDDNHSSVILLSPERIPSVTENKLSEIMPKSKQINIPRWPKPLFEKCIDNLRNDKTCNPQTAKKSSMKPKDKSDKKDKREKNHKEVPLTFDNLFNKKYNILGSGFKIAKKTSVAAAAIVVEPDNESEDSKDDVIDLVLEFDDLENPPETKMEINDEDSEAEKWCKAQNWGKEDNIDDISVLEECAVDDDDESNSSWTKSSSKRKSGIKEENIIEIDDGEDAGFMDMLDATRNRRIDKYNTNEDIIEEDNVNVITGDEVEANGNDFVEDFEDGFVWRPKEPDECNGKGKWFEIDKYNYCNSPPRFSDLVEKKVISPPEIEPVYTDRFYDLWADSKPRRNNQNHNTSSYANRFNSPYRNQVRSPTYPNMSSQRDPRITQRFNNNNQNSVTYCDTDRPKDSQKATDKSMDVWRRHIELKTKVNNFSRQENYFMSQENNARSQENYISPQENNFMQQKNRLPSPRNKQCQFVDLTTDYQMNYKYPSHARSNYSHRSMYAPYPYPTSLRPPFPLVNSYFNDPRLFYSYYQRYMTQRHNTPSSNRAPVAYTPESPDPEMMDDYDPSQYIVKREYANNNIRLPRHSDMFTPASPDPESIGSPSEPGCDNDSGADVPANIKSEDVSDMVLGDDCKSKTIEKRHFCPSPEYLTESPINKMEVDGDITYFVGVSASVLEAGGRPQGLDTNHDVKNISSQGGDVIEDMVPEDDPCDCGPLSGDTSLACHSKRSFMEVSHDAQETSQRHGNISPQLLASIPTSCVSYTLPDSDFATT